MRLSDRDGYQNNFLFRSGSMRVRVTEAMKEAFFPTRCLVCGSFFRNIRQENRSLKTFLQILSSWEHGFFGLEGFFQKTDLTRNMLKSAWVRMQRFLWHLCHHLYVRIALVLI